MYNFYIAQIFGIIGIICSVLSMQMKCKKNIMIFLLLLNLASAFNFLFLDSSSGLLISLFAVIETFINYLFDKNNKKVPIYIIIIYIVINILLAINSYNTIIDIMPLICALLYIASVCSSSESNIRKIMFCNQLMWFIYDVIVKAYMFSICSILTIISIIISIYRYDIKKKS